MDINNLFGKAESAISNAWTSPQVQGGFNSALGYLEDQAVKVIQADQSQHEQATQNAVALSLAQPAAPGSYGAYMSNLLQSPVLKQYGPALLIGVVFIAFAGAYVSSRK